jgi:hypothetical protein
VKRRRRSKPERIKIKMEQSSSVGLRNTKSILGGHGGGKNGRILLLRKSILLFLRARAGSLRYIFFFNINRVLGLIVYITL